MKYFIKKMVWCNRNNPYPWMVCQGELVVQYFKLKREAIAWILEQEKSI